MLEVALHKQEEALRHNMRWDQRPLEGTLPAADTLPGHMEDTKPYCLTSQICLRACEDCKHFGCKPALRNLTKPFAAII